MAGKLVLSDQGIYVRVDDEPTRVPGIVDRSNKSAVRGVQSSATSKGSAGSFESNSTVDGAPVVLIRGKGDLFRVERWNGAGWTRVASIANDGTLDVTDLTIAGSPIPGVGALPVEIGVACSDETTAITTGTAKATFRMPYAMTVTEVRASLTTSGTGTTTVDINEGGTTILSTKLTIDSTEKTSTTAATPAVISDSALDDDAEITIDFDAVATGAAGLKVWLIGERA